MEERRAARADDARRNGALWRRHPTRSLPAHAKCVSVAERRQRRRSGAGLRPAHGWWPDLHEDGRDLLRVTLRDVAGSVRDVVDDPRAARRRRLGLALHRGGSVLELLVFPEDDSQPVNDRHHDACHERRQFEQREFCSIPRDEKCCVEESWPFAAVLFRRGKQCAEKELDVARWSAPAKHLRLVGAGIPPFVRSTSRPRDRLTWSGELWLAAGHLISHTSTDDLNGLFLEVMHVHRRT